MIVIIQCTLQAYLNNLYIAKFECRIIKQKTIMCMSGVVWKIEFKTTFNTCT